MERRYNSLGFILAGAFAAFIGWMVLSSSSTDGSVSAGTAPVTRDGAEGAKK